MSSLRSRLTVREAGDTYEFAVGLDAFVVAAGFEERAFEVISKAGFRPGAMCILIHYVNDITGNEETFLRYKRVAEEKFGSSGVRIVELRVEDCSRFYRDLELSLASITPGARRFGIDVSGMTSYLSCLVLKCVRSSHPLERQTVIYTSARTYVPTYQEYLELIEKQGEDIEYLPRSMAQEMADNLILEQFSGHQSGDGRACLVIFAGYEIHRSSGMIEAINPSLLLLLHGNPGDETLSWRLDLAQRLHRKHEKGRRCATEVVSTLQVQESLDILERYYEFLTDDYDFVISPVCSKMHVVASYLFWEKYGEVQLTFPLPVGYNRDNRPLGVAKVYTLELPERSALARQ